MDGSHLSNASLRGKLEILKGSYMALITQNPGGTLERQKKKNQGFCGGFFCCYLFFFPEETDSEGKSPQLFSISSEVKERTQGAFSNPAPALVAASVPNGPARPLAPSPLSLHITRGGAPAYGPNFFS